MTPRDRGLEGPQASAPRAEPERPGWGEGGPEGGSEGRRRAGEPEPASGGSPGEPRRECVSPAELDAA